MAPERLRAIQEALNSASTEYVNAAEDEMRNGRGYGGYGSVHNIYTLMKESYSLQGKARNLSRRFGVDPCNCA